MLLQAKELEKENKEFLEEIQKKYFYDQHLQYEFENSHADLENKLEEIETLKQEYLKCENERIESEKQLSLIYEEYKNFKK